MTTATPMASTEVNSFEEYTLYSLDQSSSGVLGMMDRSKQIASLWPDLSAMISLPALCQDVAALAGFQHSLHATLGDFDGKAGACWTQARAELQSVMTSLEDSININDPDVIKHIFGVMLPLSLNHFAEAIPGLKQHVEEMIREDASMSMTTEDKGA
ncbi:MAG TPA: hypothetical protein DCS43_06885 [Verrucomicrobia bacterium]|nr:hypothetical protein [Verrucomicrobiota bacterium]